MGAVAFKDLITFTRASGGGRFNASGQYEWLPADTPRIDYDPVTGECRGLLVEEQRTNLLTYSSDFTNSAWVKSGATIEPAAVISPDGTASASLLRESTAAGLHNTGRGTPSVEQGKSYTASVFAKSFSGNRVLRFALFGSVANIDLATLEYNTFGSSSLTVTATRAANGFTRVAVTVTASADNSMYLSLAQNISTASNNYTGDGTSGIYIWGAQLEAGSSPSSYIPTTTAQVTRAASDPLLQTLSPWLNQSAGTFIIEHDAVAGRPLLSSGENLLASSGVAGRTVLAYDATGSYVSQNGGAFVAGPPLAFGDSLRLMRSATQWANAHCRALRYYPRRLTLAEASA